MEFEHNCFDEILTNQIKGNFRKAITIIPLFFCMHVQAQKLLPNSKVKANQITYLVVGLPKLESETIAFNSVYNNTNQWRCKTPKLKLDNGDLIGKIAKNTILIAFNEAFSKARL